MTVMTVLEAGCFRCTRTHALLGLEYITADCKLATPVQHHRSARAVTSNHHAKFER
jgi:hypothetical protein